MAAARRTSHRPSRASAGGPAVHSRRQPCGPVDADAPAGRPSRRARLGGIRRAAPHPAAAGGARFRGAVAPAPARSAPDRVAGVPRLPVAARHSGGSRYPASDRCAHPRACYARIGAFVQVRPGNQLPQTFRQRAASANSRPHGPPASGVGVYNQCPPAPSPVTLRRFEARSAPQ